ncbi:hypothetical protein lerEdw1_014371 [Lerista edwardsae]|nr:hypothetical protein lerEdw1_014371 [Lerista edwardsae]
MAAPSSPATRLSATCHGQPSLSGGILETLRQQLLLPAWAVAPSQHLSAHLGTHRPPAPTSPPPHLTSTPPHLSPSAAPPRHAHPRRNRFQPGSLALPQRVRTRSVSTVLPPLPAPSFRDPPPRHSSGKRTPLEARAEQRRLLDPDSQLLPGGRGGSWQGLLRGGGGWGVALQGGATGGAAFCGLTGGSPPRSPSRGRRQARGREEAGPAPDPSPEDPPWACGSRPTPAASWRARTPWPRPSCSPATGWSASCSPCARRRPRRRPAWAGAGCACWRRPSSCPWRCCCCCSPCPSCCWASCSGCPCRPPAAPSPTSTPPARPRRSSGRCPAGRSGPSASPAPTSACCPTAWPSSATCPRRSGARSASPRSSCRPRTTAPRRRTSGSETASGTAPASPMGRSTEPLTPAPPPRARAPPWTDTDVAIEMPLDGAGQAPALGEIRASLPPSADFLCLQEVFDLCASTHLRRLLGPCYEHIIYDVGTYGLVGCSAPKLLNSGLFLASRYPVLAVQFHYYPNSKGEDAFSAKGLLCVQVKLGSSRGQRIVGYVNCTHLHAPEGDGQIRHDQLSLSLLWVQLFQDAHGQPGDIVAFDIYCGDLNFDNCSPDDHLEQTHEIFTLYKDPCRLGPRKDKPWAIGTLMNYLKIYDKPVSTPERMQRTLRHLEGRRTYLAAPILASGQPDLSAGWSEGRRIDYILYREHPGPAQLRTAVEKVSFVTQLATLSDHLPVGLQLLVRSMAQPGE